MHPDYERADEWSNKVIGAAIEVHRDKGPGLLESIYEKCLLHELELQNIPAEKQIPVKFRSTVNGVPAFFAFFVIFCSKLNDICFLYLYSGLRFFDENSSGTDKSGSRRYCG